MSAEQTGAITKGKYRPEIDGLRAFAVVAVIINHFNKDILPGGYLGVDIFFVISGYVITSSLYGRPSKDFKDFISGFYERRIKRLVPALSLFVLITSTAICLFNPTPGVSLLTGLTSLFGLSNLFLLKQSTDYFAQSTELNVFTHTWSLGVEEQFYILFPFLIWFSGFGRQTKNGARNLFLAVGGLTIVSLICFLYLYQANQPAAYFLMPSRFWEMAAGCLIFIGFQKQASIEQFLEKVPPLLVMALIVGIMYLPMSMASASTIAVVALSSILIASLKKQTAAFKVFTNPKVVYIGLISYSLYLWHWGVLSISRWTIGIHWWSIPLQVALILGLAIASYRWIETPLRKGKWFGKRWKTLVVGGGMLGSISAGLVIIGRTNELIFAGANPLPFTRNLLAKNVSNAHCDIRNRGLDPERCNFGLVKNSNPDDNQSIYFVGSSHAGTLSGLIGSLQSKYPINLFSLYVGGTFFPPLNSQFFPGEYKKVAEIYNRNQSSILQFIEKSAKDGDIVAISNHLELFGDSPSPISANNREIVREYFKNLDRFTSKMNKINVNVILFGPMPYFPKLTNHLENTLICQKQWFKISIDRNCLQSIQRQELLRSQHNIIEFSRNWESSFENAYYFEVVDYFCPPSNSDCSNQINGEIYMFDQDHLNFRGGQFLARPFADFIQSKNLLLLD